MQVKFDSLNRFEVPKFYVCNPGCVYENNTLTNVLGCIAGTSDEELVMNFNTTSELNMRVNKVRVSDPEENDHIQKIYKALQNRRLIFVEDVGFFVITNVVDGFEAGIHYKDIRASSCEYELSNRVMPYIEDGTYRFTDLLEKIVSSLPVWKIGEINGDIAKKYRTFEDISVDQNTLSFMLEDMQDAYECIISFDCQNRLINVYDQNAYVRQTSIHLTKDDLINSIEVVENSDDLYTAISVQGNENLNIAPVNPLGTNVIYNFSYYLDWMTPTLSEKVLRWQDLVNSKLQEYYDLNLAYYYGLTDETDYSSELSKLNTQLTMYQRCRDNIVASGSTVAVKSYNEVIEKNGGLPVGVQNELRDTIAEIDRLIAGVKEQISNTEELIEESEAAQADLKDRILAVHEEVSILSYFTDDEYSELCNYIFEGNYTDEYITVTSNMTYNERFQQMKTLYDRAVMRLERISSPTKEFDLDVENFIFSSKFLVWSEELETGTLINVELEEDDVAALFLSNITVNYDDKKLTMTFGNRFNRFDPKSLFNDVLGDIKKSANSIGYIKEILYPVKDGEFDEMKEAIESSGILTKDAVLASANQEILIDDTGILGRQLLENGEYADEQIKITNKTMVFTDDGWESARTAIGNFIYNNPFTGELESHYGVIADMLIGGMVLTQDMGVHNESNSITMNSDGFTLTSDYTGDQPDKMVFTIQKKLLDDDGNPYYSKQLYIDDNGNLVLNGTISVFSPNTGGSTNLEDLVGEDVKDQIDELYSSIQNNSDTINQTIKNTSDQIYDAIRNESKNISSSIDEKIDGVTSSITEQIDLASNSIDSKYATIISQMNDQLEAHKADVGQYMQFNNDGLTLGATSSDFKTVIDNQGMYFKQGNLVVSYVSNNQLYIPDAVIENTLTLGLSEYGSFFFSPRTDGGVSLTWQE